MPIRFHLPADDVEHVGFAYSPLLETVLSLHVLVGPKHHALQHPWVRRMRRLPAALRRSVADFSFAYGGLYPDFVYPPPTGGYASFGEELERVRTMEPLLAAFEFTRPLYDHEGVRDPKKLESDSMRRHAVTDAAPLSLVPSAYVWPHVAVNCDPPWPLTLVYPAPFMVRQARPELPPDELLRLLRSVGDGTRLRALRLIAERPRTTQELAPLVGISEAGLSKHLRALADAKVVRTEREGYYVLYSLVPERVAALSGALLTFLGRKG